MKLVVEHTFSNAPDDQQKLTKHFEAMKKEIKQLKKDLERGRTIIRQTGTVYELEGYAWDFAVGILSLILGLEGEENEPDKGNHLYV